MESTGEWSDGRFNEPQTLVTSDHMQQEIGMYIHTNLQRLEEKLGILRMYLPQFAH